MSIRRLVLGTAVIAGIGTTLMLSAGGTRGATAQSSPPAARVYGGITVNGANAAVGAVVTAFSGTTPCGTARDKGIYNGTQYFVDIDSSTTACASPGTKISFKVDGNMANETISVPSLAGSPVMQNLTVSSTQPTATVTVTATTASGTPVSYPGGVYSLVGGPQGTVFNGAQGSIYTYQAGDMNYQVFPVTKAIDAGKGYWVYSANTITVNLNNSSPLPFSISAPAGQYIMIGNPSATKSVTVQGADVVYTYNASNTANPYTATTTLAPGQGAWLYSAAGGNITLS